MPALPPFRGAPLGALLCALLACVAPSAGAQARPPARDSTARDSTARERILRDSAAAAQDSLRARLARLEEELALLRRQVGDEASSAVRTRSRIGVVLHARVQTNVFANSHRVNNVDVPQFALPPSTTVPAGPGPGTRSLGASVRQSRFGAAVTADSVLGARFEGDVELDFFGGTSSGPGDRRLFPEVRLRTARARLRWERTELLVGSETPLISDLNPISVAAVGITGFVGAGNLWNWIPQLRVSRELIAPRAGEDGVRIALQGALLSPFSAALHVAEPDAVDAGERSARPFLQGRLRLAWGAHDPATSEGELIDDGGEIAVGTHRGWLRAVGSTPQSSHAVSADARVALPGHAELRAEAYVGQLLRGLGGGGIAQNFGRALAGETLGPPLRDAALWFQLNTQPHPAILAGAGCGFDRVDPDGRPVRQYNNACAVHAIVRPAQPVFIGVELRTLATRYTDRVYRGNHFNLALGFEL